MSLRVGTSGWAYKEWRPEFYPPDLAQSRFLEHYGRVLSACEINATFYRLHKDSTLVRWAEATPPTFRFALKAHRRLTHSRSMALDSESRSFLDTFLKSALTLGERLGAVLFQFPPHRRRDDAALKSLLEALPPGTPYAFEFRHESWIDPAVADSLAGAGATVCVSDTDGNVPDALPPGPIGYVRLRVERYDEESRAKWFRLLRAEAASRHVYAFAKHEGIPAHDSFGGIGLAAWMVREHATGGGAS
ncbi:MAG: DUF72 domain-containing protein [Actinomycetota bacterium]